MHPGSQLVLGGFEGLDELAFVQARLALDESARKPDFDAFVRIADGVVQDSSPGSLRLVDGGLVLLAAMRTRHSFGVQTLGLDRTSRTKSRCAGKAPAVPR